MTLINTCFKFHLVFDLGRMLTKITKNCSFKLNKNKTSQLILKNINLLLALPYLNLLQLKVNLP